MKHFYEEIKNFSHPNALKMYKNMVGELPNGSRLLEIGTFHGSSLAYLIVEMINQNKTFDIHVIDPLLDYSMEGENSLRKGDHENQSEIFHKNMKDVEQYFTLHQDFSYNVLPTFTPDYFDFIFVDGDHSTEGVYSDLTLSWKVLKIGGILAGDDYGAADGDTKIGIDRFFGGVPQFSWVWKTAKISETTWNNLPV